MVEQGGGGGRGERQKSNVSHLQRQHQMVEHNNPSNDTLGPATATNTSRGWLQ